MHSGNQEKTHNYFGPSDMKTQFKSWKPSVGLRFNVLGDVKNLSQKLKKIPQCSVVHT